MNYFQNQLKLTAPLFAVALLLSLFAAGCSDSDRDINPSPEPDPDQAILKVKVSVAETSAKGVVPADTYGFVLSLYNDQGQEIGERTGYTATGSDIYAKWEEPSDNVRQLTLEVPDELVDQVDRIEVDTYNSEEIFSGVLTMGGVYCALGTITTADFTQPDAPEYITKEEYNEKSNYVFYTKPAQVEGVVTIAKGETVTVTADVVYTDDAGLDYAYGCPDELITLTSAADELDIEGNIITGTDAVIEAPVTAAFLEEGSDSFKVTVVDSEE